MSKQAKTDVFINAEQAKAQLKEVQKELVKIKALRDKAEAEGDVKGYNQLNNEFKKLTSEAGKLQKQTFDVNTVLKNMSSASIRDLQAAYNILNRELNTMKRSDAGYAAKQKEVKALRTELAAATDEMKVHQSGIGRLADGVNKYFALLTAGAASLAGLVMGARKAIDTFNQFEQSIANLSAITGLTGTDLNYLGERAKQLSVSTTESGVRITKSATDIVEGFKLMGSARPELLANKEALAQVTEKALILAAASNIEMAPAVDAVAASMNQFNLEATQSDRIINAIAAGSLAGSAEVSDLTESMKNVGTVAADANMSLEQTVAALEVLGEKQLKGAEAGTKLRGALLKMKEAGAGYASGQFVLRDALIEVNNKLNAQGSELEKDALKQKVFGIENITAGNILLQNIDKYDKLTTAVTNTNVAFDQAKTSTSTNSAKLEQAKNNVTLLTIELGQKLAPTLTYATNTFAKFMKLVMGAPAFIKENQAVIIALTGATLTYAAVKMKTSLITLTNNLLMKEGIALKIKDAVVLQFLIIKEQLYTIWKGNGTVATKIATTAQYAWNAALNANPIGLVITAVTALIIAIKSYDKYNAESIRLETEKSQAIYQVKTANEALQTAYEKQQLAIGQLNKLSAEQKRNLLEQVAATLKAAEAELILAKAKQTNIQKENSKPTLWQRTVTAVVSYNNPGAMVAREATNAVTNGMEAGASMNEVINSISESIKQLKDQKGELNEIVNSESLADKITGKSITQLEEKQRYLTTALKNYEKGSDDYIRITKKLSAVDTQLSAGNNSGQGTEEERKKAAKESEEAYKLNLDIHKKSVESTIALMQEGTAKELAELKARYDAEKELIKHELETNAKLTPEQKTTLTTTSTNLDTRYETDKNAINNKRLADELQFQKNLIALQLEIAKEGTLGEYDLKKDQIENNRQIELAGITVTGEKKIALEKAINDKFNTQVSKLDQSKNLAVLSQNLYKESGLLNKAYNASRTTLKTQYDQGIITKKQYNDKLYALDAQYQRDILALAVREAQSKLDILRSTGLASIEELQQAQSALDGAVKASTSYDTGKGKNTDAKGKGFKDMTSADKMNFAVQAASSTADAIFKIEADKNQRILDDKLGKLQTQREMELDNKNLTEAQKEAINKKFDARERALKAAAWQKQHAADIIQSIVSGALGVLTGLAQAGIPGAILAGIVASAQIVTVASQVQPAFYKGGFTDTAFDDKKTAGVVHANEFVGSAAAVRNPSVKQFFDVIDYAQRTGAIQSLNLPAITSLGTHKAFSKGGYTSESVNTPVAPIVPDDVLSVIRANTKAIADLQAHGVTGKWVLYDLEKIQRHKSNLTNQVDM